MDRVTQDNAAVSEEVASSSEALYAEAVKMDSLVVQLTDIVGQGAIVAEDSGGENKKILGLLPRRK